jgi:hypothetical protein
MGHFDKPRWKMLVTLIVNYVLYGARNRLLQQYVPACMSKAATLGVEPAKGNAQVRECRKLERHKEQKAVRGEGTFILKMT